ncbi:MAG: hypothetical protein HW416_1612 [Chloroflexi bacterium]|nr:hypothetical protein [Chloroflexota bacterium]
MMSSGMFASPDFEELERRVANGDRTAFNELQRAHFGLVETFIVSKTNDPRAARDVTRRIFNLAWQRIDRYPWRDFSFHVWVLRIARETLMAGRGSPVSVDDIEDDEF